MKVTILGCGASGGVPRIGGADGRGDWENCDPAEPRNRRMRASILVQQGATTLLVDTSPDLRNQCLRFGVTRLDGVLYTHDHADHTHGVDDLRPLHNQKRGPTRLLADPGTLGSLKSRFAYAFAPEDESYRPFVAGQEIDGPFRVGEIDVVPFPQSHGNITSLGFRFGPIAYSTDLVSLPDESYRALSGVTVWIVDALRREPHPTHANVATALAMIERAKPERAILTHMTATLDYRKLAAELPSGIEPAYDGMVIEA